MGWLTDLQSQLRGPVFAFLGSTWQYLLIAAIGIGWYLLYTNARRDRAAAPTDVPDVSDGTEAASSARLDGATAVAPGPFGRRQPRTRAAQTPRREADTAYYPMTYDTAPDERDRPDAASTADDRVTMGDSRHLDTTGHDSTSDSGDSSSDSGGDSGGGDGGGGGGD